MLYAFSGYFKKYFCFLKVELVNLKICWLVNG